MFCLMLEHHISRCVDSYCIEDALGAKQMCVDHICLELSPDLERMHMGCLSKKVLPIKHILDNFVDPIMINILITHKVRQNCQGHSP